MPHPSTHQNPEQRSRPLISESVARNAHGQSLDAARATFRTEWQAQLKRKRAQAAQIRRAATYLVSAPRMIIILTTAVVAMLIGARFAFKLGRSVSSGLWMRPL